LHISRTNENSKRGQIAHNSNSTPKLSRPFLEEFSSSTPLSAEPYSSSNIPSPTRKRPRIDAGPDTTHPSAAGIIALSRRKKSSLIPPEPSRCLEPTLDQPRRTEQNISPTGQRMKSPPSHRK